MANILGISAFYHDSAAALLVDGQLVAAAQEERFTRNKHDEGFPSAAVDYCLSEAKLSIEELDHVVFYEKPLRKFERLLETFVSFAPFGYRSFRKAVPVWVNSKLRTPKLIRKALENRYKGRLVFTDHHEAHAASAFFPSPFEEAAILTVDGVGEWATTCIGQGSGNKISLDEEIRFPHSLGLLYSAFTYYLGFKVNSGEYKVMGLAPYGEPKFKKLILDHLIDLKEDGSFRLDMQYFNYCQGLTMTSRKFHHLFDGPPRVPESELTQRDMDIAASVQSVTEDAMLRLANHAYETTGRKNLVLAGGVALNCVANGKILRDGPFEDVWIQPASGDAGGALGAAQFVHYQLLENARVPACPDGQGGSLLGPSFSTSEMETSLDAANLKHTTYDSDESMCNMVAQSIAQGKVVGWFQGRMEFGPRALGSRSILGDARNPNMQSIINQKIKFRESFRPFAPIVLRNDTNQYFDFASEHESPYMLIVAQVLESRGKEEEQSSAHRTVSKVADSRVSSILNRLNNSDSPISSVTHVDGSARVQTIDETRNPLLHQLLTEFKRQTGCSVMINTSFNVRSEPIVCTPNDAIACFLHTDMDVLVLGRTIVERASQNQDVLQVDRKQHLNQFALD